MTQDPGTTQPEGNSTLIKQVTQNVNFWSFGWTDFDVLYLCEGLKPPLESFSQIDIAVIVMSNNY